jgi:hypothetical protein
LPSGVAVPQVPGPGGRGWKVPRRGKAGWPRAPGEPSGGAGDGNQIRTTSLEGWWPTLVGSPGWPLRPGDMARPLRCAAPLAENRRCRESVKAGAAYCRAVIPAAGHPVARRVGVSLRCSDSGYGPQGGVGSAAPAGSGPAPLQGETHLAEPRAGDPARSLPSEVRAVAATSAKAVCSAARSRHHGALGWKSPRAVASSRSLSASR